MDEMQLVHVSELNSMGCVSDESGIDDAECHRKMARGRRVAGAIRPMVIASILLLECTIVLHEPLLVPLLIYDSETMIWKENERYRIMTVQMDNLRGLLGIKRLDKVSNAQIRELCGVMKGLDERIDESVFLMVQYCSENSE